MTKKQIVETLKKNIKSTKKNLENSHILKSKEYRFETKGLIEGWKFAITLLTK